MNSDEMVFRIERIWAHWAPLSVDHFSFCSHLTDPVKNCFNEKNTNIVVIPDRLTSKLQLLDVYINKSFKDKERKLKN